MLIKINTCLGQLALIFENEYQHKLNLTFLPKSYKIMNEITTTLNDFLVSTKSTAALILNGKGKLITSLNLDYGDSIAAMSAAILSMSEKFLIDLEKGSLKQLYLKSAEGVIVGNKISGSNFIVAFSKEGSNLALLMRSTEEVSVELSKNSLLK
ncbi:Predicted regulator of Ras-like GTPase activity, Roadblock/LC7/MglB family [Flavobacterium nitrogenifigens]|uniref:Predicted regulator of Ras-like GTPase activity, Roadblock/LC7/MglB family n=3 Tax=Flavobacterium TaxID=237 RepID=A0A521D3Y9_9FLAO|nr:Predicted regulator of Ras-like GTPase activity, Roadblock/LC7/MglB family [Flavobacterium nitrogenifigens]